MMDYINNKYNSFYVKCESCEFNKLCKLDNFIILSKKMLIMYEFLCYVNSIYSDVIINKVYHIVINVNLRKVTYSSLE